MPTTVSTSPYRSLFSLSAGTHYLNCAYMAPLSHTVEAASTNAMLRQRSPIQIPPSEYFTGPDAVRRAFARLVNIAEPRRVALLPSVSYAMETAARNLPIRRDHNIVVIGEEFPSAVLPWRRLARERGAALRTIQRCTDWNAALYDAIDHNTAAVVLAHVHWSDGTCFDLPQLATRSREVGAAVVIDGTQSVGALPFDVAAVQPDMLVCAGYKWLTGGYGLSVAYFGERFDNGTPLEQVWTGQAGSEDFAHLSEYRDSYRPYADRYDGGQRAGFILVPMLGAAIDQLLVWGVETIQNHCITLLAPWLDTLPSLGLRVADPSTRAAHLFGIRFTTARDLRAVAARLHAAGVHVSIRGDAIRVSPHLYNDDEDMAALFSALS